LLDDLTSAAQQPLESAAIIILGQVRRLLAGHDRPVLLASGSGKSTLAALLSAALDAALVRGDDFFVADITDAGWAARTPAERAADAIDWRRLRAEALEPLLAGKPAVWHPFDFASGTRGDGTYGISTHLERRELRPVFVLDGAYSARPELMDLIDLSILVEAPSRVRQQRLAGREGAQLLASWHARWDEAETWYVTQVRPAGSFDQVVRTG
jgi:uridine kinase